jgi:hypothetical protein
LRHRTDIASKHFSVAARKSCFRYCSQPIVFDLLEDLIGPLNLELIVCVELAVTYNATDASTTRIATLGSGCYPEVLTAIINDVLSIAHHIVF